jgi:hypothetical protein
MPARLRALRSSLNLPRERLPKTKGRLLAPNEQPAEMEFTCVSDIASRGAAANANKNIFTPLWRMNYRALLPIVPPTAELSPHSSLAKNPGARGKAVGARSGDGKFASFNWTRHKTTEADLKRWSEMGCGVGLRLGPIDGAEDEWLVAVDSDVYDVTYARQVDEIVGRHFGLLPCRIGMNPKAAYLLRVSGPVRYAKVFFGEPDAHTGLQKHAVEILAGMRQIVLPPSIHSRTGKPYHWARPLVPLEALKIVTPEKLQAFLDDMRASLPHAHAHSGSIPTDRANVDQEALRGDPELVARALALIPNTVKNFPSYEGMRDVGIALRSALWDDQDRGLELFTDWVASWDGPGFDPELCEKYWQSFKPPFKLGAPYLFDLARKFHPEEDLAARHFFQEIPDDPDEGRRRNLQTLFEANPPSEGRSWSEIEAAARVTLSDLQNAPAPDFVLGTRFQPGVVTLGIGQPGVSKTTFAILSALSIATGHGLTREMVFRTGRVLIWSNEDSRNVTLRRIAGIAAVHGLDVTTLIESKRVYVMSGQDSEPIVFAQKSEARAPVTRGQDVEGLIEFVRRNEIIHVVLDPMVSLHRGLDENSATDMERLGVFIRDFAREAGVSVDLIHHPVKNRSQDREQNAGLADAARGSGAIIGYVRSAYTLSPMSQATAISLKIPPGEAPQYVRLDDAKQNYARRGRRERWFKLGSYLPTGERVNPADFESRDPATVKRALSSVGVHDFFDAERQRNLAILTESDDAARAEQALRDVIAASISGVEIERPELCRALMRVREGGETTQRNSINQAIPEGRAKAVRAVAGGVEYFLWRETRRGKPLKCVVRREETGQVVGLEGEGSGQVVCSDEDGGGQEIGLFD